LKIYRKALNFSKENLSTNEQLVKNLTKVVNSATEQIEEQKRVMIANINKSLNTDSSKKDSHSHSLNMKNELYKDLSKKVERYRHLPKLKMNNKEHSALYEPSYQSIDYHNIDDEPSVLPYVFLC
jgi:cysteinyl-tRNA synthetase